ncbi:hypothetical protein VTL71DRAFT_15385 [Oculimacula yallundae]|uniref:BTB domain-containing protein n=1 Tax=Oculimacula yallundae TaxID=86028 RepID=A0ABR4CHR0_9HELO
MHHSTSASASKELAFEGREAGSAHGAIGSHNWTFHRQHPQHGSTICRFTDIATPVNAANSTSDYSSSLNSSNAFVMAALDADVFRSKQFVFLIGEAQAEFAVHAAIVAKQSKALDALINGSMKEAFAGKAVFEDVEEDTFVRFCQFAYTGDYTTPDFRSVPAGELLDVATPALPNDADHGELMPAEPAWDEAVPAPTPEPAPEDDFGWGTPVQKPKKAKKLSKSSRLRQSLHNQLYDTETPRTLSAARCIVRQNSSPSEDYSPVFLSHAQLYVFAEKWGIESLKTLALSKLHGTLTTFTLYAARRPDIVELLRYAFSNTHTPDRVDGVDEMRSLVMLYTACEVESLVHCPEFLSLIGEGGQLAQDLVQVLMQRIS